MGSSICIGYVVNTGVVPKFSPLSLTRDISAAFRQHKITPILNHRQHDTTNCCNTRYTREVENYAGDFFAPAQDRQETRGLLDLITAGYQDIFDRLHKWGDTIYLKIHGVWVAIEDFLRDKTLFLANPNKAIRE